MKILLSTGVDISVELCTCGDVAFDRPSGRTCTPFESNFAIVAIKSFTDSSHALSIESVKSFEFYIIKKKLFFNYVIENLLSIKYTYIICTWAWCFWIC